MNDTISRQQALDWFRNRSKTVTMPGAKRMYLLTVEALSADGDTISRQAAINKILGQPPELHYPSWYAEQIKELPSAEPKIIYCKDCRKHNKKVGFDENFHTVWKEDACPLASWRGKAQGHEFDYQFCAYGERRTE